MNSPGPREDTNPIDLAVTTSPTDLWVQVRGEVDLSNSHRLQAALAAVDFDDADVVNLDLRQLTFCDTDGCRVLLLFEREVRLSGHQARIHGATSTVRKVLGFISDGDQPTFA